MEQACLECPETTVNPRTAHSVMHSVIHLVMDAHPRRRHSALRGIRLHDSNEKEHIAMSRLEQVRDSVLSHPFHAACGLSLVDAGEGRAELTFPVNDFTGNPQGALHGGILYALMDVSCFFAVIPLLDENEHPVSIEVNTSVLRAARPGEHVVIRSHVDRRGRTLAAMRCEAHAVDPSGNERLIATGNVTKSIIREGGA